MVTRRRPVVWEISVRALVCAILVVALRGAASAQGTDVVQVDSADRRTQVTGDVRGMERGQLSFRTDATGTIDIAWNRVVTITSSKQLDVELFSGVRYVGSISSPSDGLLVVQTATGPTMPIAFTEIARMTVIEGTFLERTTGSVDFGFNATKETTTFTLDGSARNRTRSFETKLDLSAWRSQRDGADTLARSQVSLDVRRFLSQRWFVEVFVKGQREDELELDWRFVLAGGVGRTLVESSEMVLSVDGGLDYDAERFENVEDTDHSIEVFGGVDWDWFPVGATEATLEAKTYVSLDQQRLRLEFDANVRRDIFWDLYWSVNAFDSFDSDPPDDRPRSAFGIAFGLGWTF